MECLVDRTPNDSAYNIGVANGSSHALVRESHTNPTPFEFAAALNFYAPTYDDLVGRIGKNRARHEAVFGPLESIARRESPLERLRALHAELACAMRATNQVDRAIGQTLRRFREAGGVAGMGYARYRDYVRERLGQSVRWAQERVRLATLLGDHPRAAAAHASGELTHSHLLALAPILTPETEDAWLTVAHETTVRELRGAVRAARDAGRRAPEGTDEPGEPSALPPDDPGEEPESGEWVSIPAPAAVADLFDHTLDLVRRAAGTHLSVSACIEHILSEYDANPPADVDPGAEPNPRRGHVCAATTSRSERAERREIRLEHAHDRWRALAATARIESDAHADANAEPITPAAPVPPTPEALDAELRRLILIVHRRHDRLAELLTEFRALEGWRPLGFASPAHYCREMLGISPRLAQELERVATRLTMLPVIAAARARGELTWTKLRLISSIARPDTEHAWLERARRVTVRYLERDVHAAHRRRQTDPDAWTRDGAPGPLTHHAPYANDSPIRPGANLWPDAHTSAPEAAPESAPDRPGVAAHAYARPDLPCCIRFWLADPLYDWWLTTDAAIRDHLDADRVADRVARANDNHEPTAPPPPSAPWQRLVVLLRHTLEQWDTAAYENWSEGAKIHRRHGWMCACPGCTARRNLEQHHIDFRSRGGSDDATNLVTLCATHHRHILHETGALAVATRTDGALTWTMPGRTYKGDVRIRPGPTS